MVFLVHTKKKVPGPNQGPRRPRTPRSPKPVNPGRAARRESPESAYIDSRGELANLMTARRRTLRGGCAPPLRPIDMIPCTGDPLSDSRYTHSLVIRMRLRRRLTRHSRTSTPDYHWWKAALFITSPAQRLGRRRGCILTFVIPL